MGGTLPYDSSAEFHESPLILTLEERTTNADEPGPGVTEPLG